MRYRIGAFEVDTDQYALRRAGEPVAVEPLVFDLLVCFIENAGTVVDRNQMIESVWGGRIVSDATLSSAVKSLRRALGDSGETQTFVETVRGRGFRFRVPAERLDTAVPSISDTTPETPAEPPTRPSVAVLPFSWLGDPGDFAPLGEAIPHEIILALARLRWLKVIARGSAFHFHSADADLSTIRSALTVRYVLTGHLELIGRRLGVMAELADTSSGAVIWAERLSGSLDDIHALRMEISAGIVAALESQIQFAEAQSATGVPSQLLDAWQAFHVGLKRMHEYTLEGNEAAGAMFRQAVALDPAFARAHAGLSFVHFQKAFMRYGPDRAAELLATRQHAEKAVELDPLDPFVNYNMGRSYWIEKDLDGAVPWLERATSISPNYAQGIYSRALVDTLSGRAAPAITGADHAMELSPLDPLLYGMRGVKAMSHITNGTFDEALQWAEAAARTPRAHIMIDLIAVAAAHLSGADEACRHWTDRARQRQPDVSRGHFFDALPMKDHRCRTLIADALEERGF